MNLQSIYDFLSIFQNWCFDSDWMKIQLK